LSEKGNVVSNPQVVFREGLDEWAVIYDPGTDTGFNLNSVSTYVWKRLDGKHTIQDILVELREDCDSIPDNAEGYIEEFIQDMLKRGLAGYEV
jgi:SynChlorMet cassette protein ScmD